MGGGAVLAGASVIEALLVADEVDRPAPVIFPLSDRAPVVDGSLRRDDEGISEQGPQPRGRRTCWSDKDQSAGAVRGGFPSHGAGPLYETKVSEF